MARKRKDKPPRISRRRRERDDGAPALLELIEEGVHLLRRASITTWLWYLLGTGPFVLGFLYFWNDMAHSGLAAGHVASAAVGMTALLVWMRFFQVQFLRGLWAVVRSQSSDAWEPRRAGSALLNQIQWQTTALLALPICTVITLPFAHAVSLYQNLMVIEAADDEPGDESLFQRASKLAKVWPGRAWSLLGLLGTMGFMLFLNWFTMIAFAPQMAKSLLGIDSVIVRSSVYFFNSTTFSVALGLTYLTIEPLIKSTFLLLAHHARSRTTGEDLLFDLRRLSRRRGPLSQALILTLLGLLVLLPGQKAAADSGGSEASVERFDSAIDETLSQPEYIWRIPKEEVAGGLEAPGWLTQFWKGFVSMIDSLGEWLDDLFADDDYSREASGSGWLDGVSLGDGIVYFVIAVAVLALIWGAYKLWSSRLPTPVPVRAEPTVEAMPDLTREDLTADALPRNRWLELARELIAKGELRLGLRALFLAELAHLAEEGLISLARYKSNLDYNRELARRASSDAVQGAYRASARLFDSVWYGRQPVGEGEIEQMENHLRNAGLAS